MPLDIIDTASNRIHIIEGKTIEDIIYALDYIEKERARHRVNNQKRIRPPTGNPRGRPRKNSPAPENPPA